MTKKVIADPSSKDPDDLSNRQPSRPAVRPSSRMSTRAFEKQTNEAKARLKQSTVQQESARPLSGSSQRSSYKDVTAAGQQGTNNRYEPLEDSVESTLTLNEVNLESETATNAQPVPKDKKDLLTAVDDDKESSNWTTVQHSKKKKSIVKDPTSVSKTKRRGPIPINAKTTVPILNVRHQVKESPPLPTLRSPTIIQAPHLEDQIDKRSSPETNLCNNDDIKGATKLSSLNDDNKSCSHESASSSKYDNLRKDMDSMKGDLKQLLSMFERNFRPASVISVHTSRSVTTRSVDVDSVTSRVVYTKKVDNEQRLDNDGFDNEQEESRPPPYDRAICDDRYVPMNHQAEVNKIASAKQAGVSIMHEADEYDYKKKTGHYNNRGPCRFEDDDCSEKRQANRINRSAPIVDRIPTDYYCKDDREAIEKGCIQLRQFNKTEPYLDKKDDNMKEDKAPKEEYLQRNEQPLISQNSLRHRRVKNDKVIHPTENNQNDGPLFGQNEFSIKCTNNKIIYADMVSFLKDKKMEDDSVFQMEKLYNNIIGGVTFALQSHITFFPNFRQLTSTILFSDVFLCNLHGSTLEKCKSVFDRMGAIVKDLLTSSSIISESLCPKAHRIIKTNKIQDGWTMLEKLLRGRVVMCGAKPDIDLDILLAHLTLEDDESIHSFYVRTKELINMYRLQYRYDTSIPFLRIVTRFTQELMRAPEYVPYLAMQYRTILSLTKQRDQQEQHMADDFIPYTVENIYEILDDLQVNDVPTSLTKSTIQRHRETLSAMPASTDPPDQSEPLRSIIASYENNPILTPIIANLSSTSPSQECTTPQICAFRQPKKRCHACLLGFHEEVNCYLRGQNFMPEELKQRINRYNATHGKGPPRDHKPPPYKPSSVNAELSSSQKKSTGTSLKRKPRPLPFSNNKTKQPSVNLMEQLDSQEEEHNVTNEDYDQEGKIQLQDVGAAISAFVTGQMRDVEDNGDFYLDNPDDIDPIICVLESSVEKRVRTNIISDSIRGNVDFNTPDDLLQVISVFHRRNRNSPNQHFLRQHSDKLSKLPHDIFRFHSQCEFQVDSGANVGAINDRSLFYFYIPTKISVEQAGGAMFTSEGWGGVLIEFEGRVRLHAPVHYTPTAPRNIFSPGAMISFSGFKDSTHRLHQSLDMKDNRNFTSITPLSKKNGLNFANFRIMSFDHSYYDMTRSVPTMAPASVYKNPIINSQKSTIALSKGDTFRESKRKEQIHMSVAEEDDKKHAFEVTDGQNNIAGKDNDEMITLINGKKKKRTKLEMPRLTHNALSHIASMYINLYPASSPRSTAITTMNSLLGNIYKVLPSSVPQIFTDQPIIAQLQFPDEIEQPIISSKLTRKALRSLTKFQEYLHLHIGAMHSSDSTIIPMIKNKLLRDLPSIHREIGSFDCTCIFCILTKATKLPRGHLVDYTRLRPFQQLHMDFALYNHISLRGMTSALGIMCASTSYPFGFPTKNRNPPLATVRYLISTLRSMGFEVNIIRVDEDGALAKSAEFCRLVIRLNCVLQTTSGGNSENNGKVERPHRTQANMVRAGLATMKTIIQKDLPDKDIDVKDFWCFAYSHAIHTQRRLYTKSIDDIPYYVVHQKRPSAKELVPFGSVITVVNPNKDKLPKLSDNKAAKGYFLGFGNHVRSLLYWDPRHPSTYKRSYHAIIEDTMTITLLQESFTTPVDFDKDEVSQMTTFREFKMIETPFPMDRIKTARLPIPPPGTPLGFNIKDDEIYNIPYLWTVQKGSVANKHMPKELQRNHFILNMNGNSPITSEFVKEHIAHLQKIGEKELIIDVTHRGTGDSSTTLEISRAIFDQIPLLHQNRPIISSLQTEAPISHQHFVQSSSKPVVPKFFHECLRSPLRKHWIAAARVAFEKNQKIAVFSLPFPRKDLNAEERVFSTVLVPEVKQTDIPGIWELRIRECIVGTKQEKSIDFEESYSPTVSDTAIKLQIAFCAALGYTLSIIDVKNAFQNTISKKSKRIFVTVPPTYMDWINDFEDNVEFSKDVLYVRQMLNANQGTRDAGNQWYTLLTTVLKEYGLIRATVDHGFFVKDFGDSGKLYVSLATDDLLCGYLKIGIFHDFVTYLRQFFTIVAQCGRILKFLGARIIQSEHAISIDHAQFIYSICEGYFGKNPKPIRTVSIPMRTDGEFEKELHDSPPLSADELVQFALKYNGGFRSHIGKLNFPVSTRFDIQFAVQRLSEYSAAPTAAAFEGIDRVYRYLAHDILRPLVFPRENLNGSSTISIALTPEQSTVLKFDHLPTLFTDAELARDLQTRRSYYCIVVTVLGVIILCKIRKSSTVMLHTTDSEAQASYDGVRRLIPIRALCEFMGYPLKNPSKHFVDNAAVHQIITSERMTPRCRHFDLPIAFLHEKVHDVFDSELIKTWSQLGDIGTKPLVRAIHKKFKYIGSGACFLPPVNSQHHKDLEMEYYEVKFSEIKELLKEHEEK